MFVIAAWFMAAALLLGCSETAPDGAQPLKFSVGAEGGECNADGTCNTVDLVCDTKKTCIKNSASAQCEDCTFIPSCDDALKGSEGCPCSPEVKCTDPLVCKNSVCSKCTADVDCGSGKACSTSGSCEVKPCPDGMVLIEGGQFQMGSSKVGNDDCSKDDSWCRNEYPPRDVAVSDFCMDENEFTNKNRDDLKGSSTTLKGGPVTLGTDLTWPVSPNGFNLPTQPLVVVSWFQAKAICEKQGKSLPTEAEWEYAARGGSDTCEHGTENCAVPSNTNACWSGGTGNSKTKTCNTGSSSKNVYGLYDMSGNVWEWVADRYGVYGASPQTDSKGPAEGQYRVLRGGAWNIFNPLYLRAALRHYNDPNLSSLGIGLRCVVAPQDATD